MNTGEPTKTKHTNSLYVNTGALPHTGPAYSNVGIKLSKDDLGSVVTTITQHHRMGNDASQVAQGVFSGVTQSPHY
jgi:hypothetical protein